MATLTQIKSARPILGTKPRGIQRAVFYFENSSVLNARSTRYSPPRGNSRFPDPLPASRIHPRSKATGYSARRKEKSGAGFALIELLLVISIVGLLASVVLASLNTARAKARDVLRIQGIVQLRTALALYFADYSRYPLTTPAGTLLSSTGCPSGTNTADSSLISGLTPTYISALPKDPKTPYCYRYISDTAGKEYYFYEENVMDNSVPATSPFYYADKSIQISTPGGRAVLDAAGGGP